MCGIVGYIGQTGAQEILLTGLEKLEYRGYDSAGIYVVDQEDQGHLFKEKGRIQALRDKVDFSFVGKAGIGHTRWATHGVPSVANAHPHQSESGRFTLVHNGVIENFQALKDQYFTGQDFPSQTDTVIVVELIDYFAQKEGLSGLAALKRTLKELRGSYAFGLIDQAEPGKLFVAKNKSPLLIGKGQGFNTTVSDAMASIQLTSDYFELADGDVAVLTADQVYIEDQAGQEVDRDTFKAEIDADDLEKGTYDYYMLKEIDEQAQVMRHILQAYGDDQDQVQVDAAILNDIQASDRIYIIAAGTSMHAGYLGKHYLEKWAHIPTEVHIASEFSYNMPLLSEKPFFIFISQSGETADSRAVLVQIKAAGYPSLTITNVKGSTLSRESDHTMLLHAGPEIAVASTKAYTGQIAVLAVLANSLGRAKGLDQVDLYHELGLVAQAMDTVLADKDQYQNMAQDFFVGQDHAFYIGRGLDYYVSLEAALKLKEISYIHTEGFAAGELKHGTIALIEAGLPVVAIISQASLADHVRGNLEEVRSRGAHSLVIVTEDLAQAGDQIILPQVHPDLTPLLTVIPTQLLAYYVTLALGLDVDKPRNLAKSVTVE
ncbi:glutamine--fructose-6-phosphate aminotransferase [Aerococcus urinaehominis]|uniref:Glutamine--fructose-6-phosphate aminotransferase [isomerizing] n=1 Tax=Aerococcus urinaehominis TaxID=128944 RepID=A0A0X8FLD8_9LACT|nr:glutamine--fructose-6-phosphate transaminase (isomerizing) [Aerococcus urinaehominis]AMB99372.1 glutamine--fructose-6-phosphate aminotransferase [Aerococcus urinaehominis]SDM22790.1 glucosamine--fructose-6-phosphate aminotransferase (isomerizing) [Aerococcus urinaehominis]